MFPIIRKTRKVNLISPCHHLRCHRPQSSEDKRTKSLIIRERTQFFFKTLYMLLRWLIWPIQSEKTTETMAYGYSSENTQQELSNEYQHEMFFKNHCALVSLEESSLSIGKVNSYAPQVANLANANVAKNLKNYWNHGTWVIIWEFSARAFQ